ncbi:hypothetical protein FKM82_030115 [Ascaphus truei]
MKSPYHCIIPEEALCRAKRIGLLLILLSHGASRYARRPSASSTETLLSIRVLSRITESEDRIRAKSRLTDMPKKPAISLHC